MAIPMVVMFVVNNLYTMLLFFSKILKIELNKRLQGLFYNKNSITTCKLKFLITFISLTNIGMTSKLSTCI